MILESLVKDASILTLDCAKARLGKGDAVSIDDKHWHSPEIQGAIKLGLIRLVGDEPTVPKPEKVKTLAEEETKAYVNVSPTKIAFEIKSQRLDDVGEPIRWKEYAEAKGGKLNVPVSLVNDVQIQNALSWGLLVDPAVKERKPVAGNSPVKLEELTEDDLKTMSSRPVKKKRDMADPIKAKPISAVADSGGESPVEDLFKESKVIDHNLFDFDKIKVAENIHPELLEVEESEELVAEPVVEKEKQEELSGFFDLFGIKPEKTLHGQDTDEGF